MYYNASKYTLMKVRPDPTHVTTRPVTIVQPMGLKKDQIMPNASRFRSGSGWSGPWVSL